MSITLLKLSITLIRCHWWYIKDKIVKIKITIEWIKDYTVLIKLMPVENKTYINDKSKSI